ncbi:unnamed protein product, partial [Prorocentrum cordatum]
VSVPEETAETDPDDDRVEMLFFSVEALWAVAKVGKYETDEDDIVGLTSYLTEEPDTSVFGRSEVISDDDAMEAWITQGTNYGRATAEVVKSLQPERVMQVGFAAEAWKMLSEQRVAGNPGHEGDAVVLSFYEDGTAKAVIERDDSTLMPAEKIEHREALRAARLKELRS